MRSRLISQRIRYNYMNVKQPAGNNLGPNDIMTWKELSGLEERKMLNKGLDKQTDVRLTLAMRATLNAYVGQIPYNLPEKKTKSEPTNKDIGACPGRASPQRTVILAAATTQPTSVPQSEENIEMNRLSMWNLRGSPLVLAPSDVKKLGPSEDEQVMDVERKGKR